MYCPLHAPAALSSGREPPVPSLRAGLHDVEKTEILLLPGLELRYLGRSACNQSLCNTLSYKTDLEYVTLEAESIGIQ
jgi:hypothetical protein